MSFYQSWSIAPTKSRPHPGALGEASFLDSIDWVGIANASLKELPAMISGATSQASSQAQAQGASPSQIAALQAQIAQIASNRQRLEQERDKQRVAQDAQRRKDIKTRNFLILGGIGVVGLLGAILILK